MALAPGTVLNNRYRIVRLLAQGGMGAVYRAWDISLNKPCALKENLATSPDASRQFLREAQILSGVNHPNLPRVTDHFSLTGQGQYLVMDFVEGEDLNTICKRQGVLSEAQALPWITQVCEALTYLHGHVPPIIHRDIKPANIRITPTGQAMLVDFGIAKIYHPKMATIAGARAITPGYSPPEQYTHSGTTPQSDIYSLGATIYTLLTGVQLPESINLLLAERQGMKPATIQPPHLIRPDISLSTSMAIMKAINLDPNQRFLTVTEFKQALIDQPVPPAAYLAVNQSDPLAIQPPVATGHAFEETNDVIPAPPRAPRRWANIVIGFAVIAVLAVILVAWWLNRPQGSDGEEYASGKTNVLPTLTEVVLIPVATTSIENIATPAPILEPTFTPILVTEIIPSITRTVPPRPTLPPPLSPTPTLLTSARVLWDTSHGPRLSSTGQYYDPGGIYKALANLLSRQGITVVSGSLSDLSGYEAVVVATVSSVDQAYSSQEAAELLRYVEGGGGLLIMGEQPGFSNHLQAVGDVFGVQFAQPPELNGACNQFATHSIFSSINQIHFYQGGSLGVSGASAAPPREIAWIGSSIAIAQALPGTGRMIAIGDGALFDERILPEDDNEAFAVNLFRWLTFMIN